jgi:2-keto-4-pentenoate hydratase/2-oxohepta-3-ene-1,7-dioic acid hydratase in catechol pathway
MIFSVARALPLLRASFPLVPGDVVFTGTPKGVGPLSPGQRGTLAWGDKLMYSVLFK